MAHKPSKKGDVLVVRDLGSRKSTREEKIRADRLRKENKRTRRREGGRDKRDRIDLRKPRETNRIDLRKPREKGVGGKLIEAQKKIITSPKTTAVLVTTLAALTTAGLSTGAISTGTSAARGTAVITRTATIRTGTLGGKASLTTQRAFIGRGGKTVVDKLFQTLGRRAPVAARFRTNTKSIGLTRSILSKAGMATGITALVGTVIGTYPFAEFELAEATDKIGIAIFQAAKAGDKEQVNNLTAYLNDMTNPTVWDEITSKIPFANVVQNVRKNIEAAQVSAESIRKTTAKILNDAEEKRIKEEQEGTFEEQARQFQDETRERKLQEREEDARLFEEQQTANRERELRQREEDTRFFEELERKRREAELQQREEDAKFFEQLAAEREEKQRKDTLFFEAIRKRDAGLNLTDEELAILEERGVSRDTFASGGRSRVQF